MLTTCQDRPSGFFLPSSTHYLDFYKHHLMHYLLRLFCYLCLFVWLELLLKIESPKVAQATSNSKSSCLGLAPECWDYMGLPLCLLCDRFYGQFCPEFFGDACLVFPIMRTVENERLDSHCLLFVPSVPLGKPLNKSSVRACFCAGHLVNPEDSV